MKNFLIPAPFWVKPVLTVLTVVFLIGDSVHSFRQHNQMCLDGDMTFNVLKSEDVNKILHDPFALKVLLYDEQYLNPNRYFSHLANYEYCWNVPIWLQQFVDPITSIYLAQACFKLLLQLFLIALLAIYINPFTKWYTAEFLLPALLVTPFFQTFGFNHQMGIIDKSMTYDFFYAMPIVFVFLFFIPVYKYFKTGKSFSVWNFFWMIPCALIVAFSGPLNLGVAPLVSLFCIGEVLRRQWLNYRRFDFRDKTVLACTFLLLCCAYSLFINAKAGTMAENIPPLSDRFTMLVRGIPDYFTEQIGLGWLTLLIALNLVVLHYQMGKNNAWMKAAKWILVFCVIYILLLPFGGYRSYRPTILRFDTAMPVTLALVWLFGATAYTIISTNVSKLRFAYYFVIIYSLIYFTQFDKLGDSAYDCERNMLKEIAQSGDEIVKLSEPCSVIDWQVITDYRNSEKQAELLFHWNVVKEKKLYYYTPEVDE